MAAARAPQADPLKAVAMTGGVIPKGLRPGALRLPASLAVALAAMLPASSFALATGLAPGVILIAVAPALMLASGYYFLNRADPDCGQSFSWSVRAFGPQVGWIVGFLVVAASLLVLSDLAQVAGRRRAGSDDAR